MDIVASQLVRAALPCLCICTDSTILSFWANCQQNHTVSYPSHLIYCSYRSQPAPSCPRSVSICHNKPLLAIGVFLSVTTSPFLLRSVSICHNQPLLALGMFLSVTISPSCPRSVSIGHNQPLLALGVFLSVTTSPFLPRNVYIYPLCSHSCKVM